jgi:hypothetical protein
METSEVMQVMEQQRKDDQTSGRWNWIRRNCRQADMGKRALRQTCRRNRLRGRGRTTSLPQEPGAIVGLPVSRHRLNEAR